MSLRLKPFKNKPSSHKPPQHSKVKRLESPVRVSKQGLIALNREAESLSLKTVKIRSIQGGHYLSPFKGRGMEFDEVRPYQAGDDMRTLDWRVMARTGKPHTKLFREERERSVLFWVDYRAPMFFATRGIFKSVMAARAASLLAWSAVHHGDRLGGLIFSEQHHQEMRPQRGKKGVLHFIQSLVEHPAWGNTDTENKADTAIQALMRLRRVAHPGSLIFLISDFRAMGDQAERHLGQLTRHNDVVMLFIHDLLEQNLPPAGLYRVSDGTKDLSLDTTSKSLRKTYHEKFEQRKTSLQNLCRRYGIYYLPCTTSDDLLSTLQRGLGLSLRQGSA